MKRLLPAAAAVLLVVCTILLVMAWREIGTLREEVADLRNERDTQRFHPASPGSDHSSSKKEKSSAGGPKISKAHDDETEEKSSTGLLYLASGSKDQIEKRSASRLALLKRRLNLRPDQLAALERHAAKHNAGVAATWERLTKETGRPPDMGVFIDWVSGRLDLPVKELLDEEQSKLFTGFDAEDRSNRIENLVNMELTELHGEGAIQLSAEQKDKAFAALTVILAAEDDLGSAYFADDGHFSSRIDESLARRREALQAILDAGQLESYDQVLEGDRASVKEMFPSVVEGKPGK